MRAIFFDLDGTLWDSRSKLVLSWNETMEKMNLPYRFTFDDITSFMGLTPKETIDICFKDLPYDKGHELFMALIKGEVEYLTQNPGEMFPQEVEVLERLSQKYPLFIVSNCEKGYIESYLTSLKMEKYFKGHLSFGDTQRDKWENIVELKNRYQFEDVIYLGDTKKDFEECKKAHVKFIHASYGFGKIDEEVTRIHNLNELEEAIELLFND